MLRTRKLVQTECKQAGLNSAEVQPRTAIRKRQRRRWFSRKYYASVMRIKEFYEENIGRQFLGVMSDFANQSK